MQRSNSAAVREQIIDAWQAAVPPGEDRICAPTYDDEGVGAYFRGRTWDGHEVASLRYHSVGLSFFTAEAFAYYLAAYMLAVIDDASTADVIYDGILFHLSPIQLGKTWADTYLARLAQLSPAQRHAIVAYLDWCDAGRADEEISATRRYLLTGTTSPPSSALDCLLELAGATHRATSLRLGSTTVSDAQLAALAELPGLRELDLGGTAITETGLLALAGVPDLEVLELSNCRHLSAAGLARVGQLRNLRELTLANTDVDDVALQALAPLALRRLDLTHARRITPAGWAALDVSRLERLDLYGVAAPDALLVRLGEAARLVKLVVQALGDEGLVVLASAPLVELNVSDAARVTEHGLAALGTIPTLRTLGLGGLGASRWPRGFPALDRLVLLGLELRAELATGITALTALSELRLFGGSCQPGALAALASTTAVRELTLWCARAGSSLPELAGTASLTTLHVHSGNVTATDLAVVAELPSLTCLRLGDLRAFDDTALRALALAPQLRELVLEDVALGDTGLEALATCRALRSLRIARTHTPRASLVAFRMAHPDLAIVEL